MGKIIPFLWYDGAAVDAASFYVTLLPDSRIDRIVRAAADTPSGPQGHVMLVEFTLAGQKFAALNGGPQFRFTEAVSFQIETADQAETDRLWDAIIANGGTESDCGWCKDRWGLSWQITPKRLLELIGDPEPERARAAMEAMMQMKRIDIAALERAVSSA